jgi:hypothetical protein
MSDWAKMIGITPPWFTRSGSTACARRTPAAARCAWLLDRDAALRLRDQSPRHHEEERRQQEDKLPRPVASRRRVVLSCHLRQLDERFGMWATNACQLIIGCRSPSVLVNLLASHINKTEPAVMQASPMM